MLPDAAQLDFDLEAIHQILVVWGLQLCKVSWEELGEYTTKVPEQPNQTWWCQLRSASSVPNVPVHFLPGGLQGVTLVPVQLLDRLLDLLFVLQHGS